MVISMVKPNWIIQCCLKCFFYSGLLHMNLECRDTKLLACFWVCLATLKGRANKEKERETHKTWKEQ